MTSTHRNARARGLRGPGPLPRRSSRAGDRRKWTEIVIFVGPALVPVPRLRDPPGDPRGRLQLLQPAVRVPVERPQPRALHRVPELRAGADDPEFTRAIGNNFFILAMSLLIQGPIAIGVALLLNRSLQGARRVPAAHLRPVRPRRGDRRPRVEAAPAAATAPSTRRSRPSASVTCTRNWLADPAIALWTIFFILTWKYIGFAHHPDARRTPGRARGAHRGRRRSTARAGGRCSGTSRFRCSPRPSASGRSCRSSARCRSSTWCGSPSRRRSAAIATETMATYMVAAGPVRRAARLRQRHRRHPLRHLAGRRPRLPALRPPPRSRRRRHLRGALMSLDHASSSATSSRSRRPIASPAGASTGGSPSSTSSRSSSSAIADRPGRSTSSSAASAPPPTSTRTPPACRTRGRCRTGRRCSRSPRFWGNVLASTILAVATTPARSSPGSWRRSSSRATASAGAACSTPCSPRA